MEVVRRRAFFWGLIITFILVKFNSGFGILVDLFDEFRCGLFLLDGCIYDWIRRQVLYCIAFGNGVEAVNLFSMKCTIV